MKKYLDDKLSIAAQGAGNPFFIIFNLFGCIAACIFAHDVWLDVGISIWTLILDLIIINQNNRINVSNTDTLDRIFSLEQQMLSTEERHTEMLETIIAKLNDKTKS